MGGEAPAAGGPPPSAPHPLTLRVLFAPFPVLFFLVPTPTPLFETAGHGFSVDDLASSWVVVGVSRLCASCVLCCIF